jgi:AraC-like DNA-binding protein
VGNRYPIPAPPGGEKYLAQGLVTGGRAGAVTVVRSAIMLSKVEFPEYFFCVPLPGLDFRFRVEGRDWDFSDWFPPSVAGLRPGVVLRADRTGPCPPMYNIIISRHWLHELSGEVFDAARLELPVGLLPMHDGLGSDLARFHDEVQKDVPESRKLVESLATLVAIGLLRSTQPELESAPLLRHRHPGVARALRLIKRSYRENLTVADMARSAGLGASQFLAVFKRDTGFTPHDALCRARIAEARRLLRSGSLVTATCFAVGFSSLAGFEEAFSRLSGTTPSAYRAAAGR